MPQKHQQKFLSFGRTRRKPLFILAALLLLFSSVSTRGFGVFAASCSSSSDCQAQINALSVKNDQAASSLSVLETQAGSYQAAINALQQQINGLQSQISANQKQQQDLEAQIQANQVELAKQKATLAEDVKQTYISGQLTPVEMLATSNNLSEYIDKQKAYSVVQDKIQDTLKTIGALQRQLQAQKAQVDQLLLALSTQKGQLDATQSEQDNLLSMNQSQQATFNSQISANKSQIQQLQRQQASMIQAGTRGVFIPPASGGSGGACDNGNGNGSYPMAWCNAPQDTVATIPYSSDPINRECTSYAYWYFTQVEGRSDFHASGDAKYWASSSNYATHSSPLVGSIAVETSGTWGHVAIVQALPGQNFGGNTVPSGYILVSEMNYDWYGHFRYSYSPISKFSAYIY